MNALWAGVGIGVEDDRIAEVMLCKSQENKGFGKGIDIAGYLQSAVPQARKLSS